MNMKFDAWIFVGLAVLATVIGISEGWAEQQCGPHEIYNDCGTACPETCRNHGKPRHCTTNCVPGCFCEDGFVRQYFLNEGHKGHCIRLSECPKHLSCGKNETYKNCDSPCDDKCDCPNDTGEICAAGCFCVPGFVRNENSKCVRRSDCHAKPLHYGENEEYQEWSHKPSTCGKHEEHLSCGTACPITCDNKDDPPSACILVCVDGCFCTPPYIRKYKNSTATGPCILPSECPKKPTICGENEIYSNWPLLCDGTCDYPASTKTCPKGCFCKPGFVRDKYGHCIHANKCNSKPSQCGYNEEYSHCGTACPVTCQNVHQMGMACTQNCVPGCFCKFGFIREYKNATGTGPCICPTDCPQNCHQLEKCGQNEVYKKCGTACEETCNFKFQCIEKCIEGCFCQEGYVREKMNGKCVLRCECPKIW